MSCMAVVVWPQAFASLKCRGGARRVFTDQADMVAVGGGREDSISCTAVVVWP